MRFLVLVVAALGAATLATPALAGGSEIPTRTAGAAPSAKTPPPPKFPKNFDAKGRYIVRDLDVDVPFTWTGKNGEYQMIAGGEQYPIYFTNVISGGNLYTLTYKWPDLARQPCSDVGPFSLADLNTFLASSRYVGPETLERSKPRHVDHWRVGVVWEPPPGVLPPELVTPVGGTPETAAGQPKLRLPLMQGDFYVDQQDPTTIWQVLHFGLQNLYDPQLDEWIVLDKFSRRPGKVSLPAECAGTPAPAGG